MNIFLSSKNPEKVRAVLWACQSVFHGQPLKLLKAKLASGVSKQPIGWNEIHAGSLNRARGGLLAQGGSSCALKMDYSVGIESGVVYYHDLCYLANCVTIIHSRGRRSVVIHKDDNPLPEGISQSITPKKTLRQAFNENNSEGLEKCIQMRVKIMGKLVQQSFLNLVR